MNKFEEMEERFYRLRPTLRSRDGRSYVEFKASLRPRFARVWLQIVVAYAFIAAVLVGLGRLSAASWPAALILIPVAALAIGYATAFINLFFHEAAHYNVASSRAWNDRLANGFIGLPVGAAIQNYRPIHFGHHRHHGTTMDTEISYFDPLNTRFLVESMLGLRSVRALAHRKKLAADPRRRKEIDSDRGMRRLMLGAGLAFNGALVGGCLWLGRWAPAIAWVAGVFLAFPFFAALRQVLEHRDEAASATIDYRLQPHGRVNRLFGDGPLASTLGSAGFNRHLLHHWEPQVSCTRLKDLELFLRDTSFGDDMQRQQATYLGTFRRLFNR